jgi:hypothetical protein
MLIRTPVCIRHSFTAPEGFVIIGCDFKSQEVKTAAYLSQDPTMLKAFTDPVILERLENNLKIEYSNPWVDLHSMTARGMYPELFEGRPEWEWIDIASNTVRDGMIIRKSGKVCNFS